MKIMDCLFSKIVCGVFLALAFSIAAMAVTPKQAVLLNVKGGIGPATQDFVHRGLAKAAQDEANLAIIRLDTPGGLATSMRGIIRDILSSPVPVVTYVAPSGARAASAGTGDERMSRMILDNFRNGARRVLFWLCCDVCWEHHRGRLGPRGWLHRGVCVCLALQYVS